MYPGEAVCSASINYDARWITVLGMTSRNPNRFLGATTGMGAYLCPATMLLVCTLENPTKSLLPNHTRPHGARADVMF